MVTLFDRASGRETNFETSNPVSAELRKLDVSDSFSRPRPGQVRLSRYIAGMAMRGTHILVLLDLPYIDVHEYDSAGKLVSVYVWKPPTSVERLFGLATVGADSAEYLIVGACYSGRDCQVLRFRTKGAPLY